uniref:peptide-methionine (S)-S-oxide reductase n=1 Tax=Cacopsylla melanoneura TaxID=428564 RepID=A0A8D8Y6A0_9HEMI
MSSHANGHQNGDSLSNNTKTAVLAMGCFWAPDGLFGTTKGVLRTKVGYAGGTTENPTYRNIGDHTEVTQVDFDPTIISFDQILRLFWKHHDPTVQMKTQYRSMILYVDPEDKSVAEKSLESEQTRHKRPINTIIAPFKRFYDAEDYHQKYRLRQHTYLHSKLNFKTEECYKTSHVASRLNGYVVGFGGVKQFEEEADKLGLSDDVKTYVRKYVVQYEGSGMMC